MVKFIFYLWMNKQAFRTMTKSAVQTASISHQYIMGFLYFSLCNRLGFPCKCSRILRRCLSFKLLRVLADAEGTEAPWGRGEGSHPKGYRLNIFSFKHTKVCWSPRYQWTLNSKYIIVTCSKSHVSLTFCLLQNMCNINFPGFYTIWSEHSGSTWCSWVWDMRCTCESWSCSSMRRWIDQ